MSLKSGKGAHRAPSRQRSPHAIGALGVAVAAAVLSHPRPDHGQDAAERVPDTRPPDRPPDPCPW
ncbi:hypothetical protein SANTM175S_09797 [Streptomyces antimycoticus]